MLDDALLFAVDRGVATIRLNRPDVGNALDAAVAHRLAAAVAAIERDDSVRVVVLGATGRHFCAGGDIGEFLTVRDRLADAIGDELAALNPVLVRLRALPVPIVTALNGPVAGGGIGLALCGDLVVAAESARFRSVYSAIGLSPDAGTSFLLVRALGATRAKELMFLNRSLSAADALAWGLVNRVVPDDRLDAEVDSLVAALVALPAGSLAAVKALVAQAADGAYEGVLASERRFMIQNAAGADAREGIAAFIDRRAPAFGGAPGTTVSA